jgi:S1-C subfamily serine protease
MHIKVINRIVLFCALVLLSISVAAQDKKDIPTIARDARGAVVSIVMSDKNGHAVAQGSGFLVSKDGVILTNYHVISEGSSAIVKFPDGAFYVVDGVLAFDKARDVAIIKAHGANFRTLTLGNSDQVQVGEEVVAIGNPLSLESTVSNGIVSGNRTIEEEGGKFLQVTTPISPGSSGGPLFNMAGEVVGITTLYLKGGENLNFAIPINDAKRLLVTRFAKAQDFPNETELPQAQAKGGDTPSLRETLSWMENFSEGHGWRPDLGKGGTYIGHDILTSVGGCSVMIASTLLYASGASTIKKQTETIELGDMDPTSVRLDTRENYHYYAVDFRRTDAANKVEEAAEMGDGSHMTFYSAHVSINFDSEESARQFVSALTHAVQLCGGKHLF